MLSPRRCLLTIALALVLLPACSGGETTLPFCAAVDEYSKFALAPGGTARDPDAAIAALNKVIKAADNEQDKAVFTKMRVTIAYARDKKAGKDVGEPPETATFDEITAALGGRCPPQ